MITLHVDLPHTTMADFNEHFENIMELGPNIFIDAIEDWPLLDTGEARSKHVLIRWYEWTEADPEQTRWPILVIQRLYTGKTRLIYLVQLVWTIKEGEEYLLRLDVTRFRHDRLRITMTEMTDSVVYAPKFLTWLQQGWGEGPDGVIILDPLNAPTERTFEPLPEPDSINDYMATFGYERDSTKWWDIYLDWVFNYRSQRGRKALNFKDCQEKAGVSETTFTRRLREWEERTGRERDTR